MKFFPIILVIIHALSACSKSSSRLLDTYLFQEPQAASPTTALVQVQVDLLLNDNGIEIQDLASGNLYLSAQRLQIDAQGQRTLSDLTLERNQSGTAAAEIPVSRTDLQTPISLSFDLGGSTLRAALRQVMGLAGTEYLIVYRLTLRDENGENELLAALGSVNPDVVSEEVTHLTVATSLAVDMLSEANTPLITASDIGHYQQMVAELVPIVNQVENKISNELAHPITDLMTVAKTLVKSAIIADLNYQQKLANVVATLPEAVKSDLHFASKLDAIVVDMRDLPAEVEESILTSTRSEYAGEVMQQITRVKNLPIIFTASSLQFSDSDILPGRYAGTLLIGRASDESDVKAYVIYIGEDSGERGDLKKIAEVLASGDDLRFSIPAGTGSGQTLTSPGIWVYTRNALSELTIGLKFAFTDKQAPTAVPQNIPSSILADGLFQTVNGVSGKIEITRAEDESDVSSYDIYWGSDDDSKLAGEPIIASIDRTEEDLHYEFPQDTPVPAGATTILVYTSNSLGDSTEPASVGIPDVVSYPAPTLVYSGSLTVLKNQAMASFAPAASSGPIESCSAAPNLPTGLLLANDCTISGTATLVSSQATYVIQATGPGGSVSSNLDITVNEQLPQIAYSTPASFVRQSPVTLSANSSLGPITSCSVSPALPTGLSLDNSSCDISGTPTQVTAQASYTITAVGPGGTTPVSLSLEILDLEPLVAYGGALTTSRNAVVNHVATNTGGAITTCGISPALPAGLSLNTSTCSITGTAGTPAAQSAYAITVQGPGGTQSLNLNLTINEIAPQIVYTGISHAATLTSSVNVALSSAVTNAGGPITSCSISPALPSGLTISNTTCAITGTPTSTLAKNDYTVTASNSAGSGTAQYSLTLRYYCGGAGTLSDPYLLCDAKTLAVITSGHLSSHFALAADIDLSGTSKADGYLIGAAGFNFSGSLDGRGYSLSHFELNNSSLSTLGLFRTIQGSSAVTRAAVRNLVLKGFRITAGSTVGALAGTTHFAEITDVRLEASSSQASAITGTLNVGGLVGSATQTLCRRCYVDGSVSGTGAAAQIGGLVGLFTGGEIVTSQVHVTVNANNYVGGMVGYSVTSDLNISESHADVTVQGNSYVGGLVGYLTGSVTSSRVFGAVTGLTTGTMQGGVIGYHLSGTVKLTEFHGDLTGISDLGGITGKASTSAGAYSECLVTGSISIASTGTRAGGLVGDFAGTSLTLSQMTGSMTHTGSGSYFGGLVGYQSRTTSEIAKSSMTGNLLSAADNVGGLVGDSRGSISQSFFDGNVRGLTRVGGIVGLSSGTISNAYSKGTIKTTAPAGGAAVDFSTGGIVGVYNGPSSLTITNAYSTATLISNEAVGSGGILGYASNTTGLSVISSYSLDAGPSAQGSVKTQLQLQDENTFAGWDFATPIWSILNNETPRFFFPRTVNTYGSLLPTSIPGGSTSVTVGSSNGFAPGDSVLFIQMQDGSASQLAGTYEFATVATVPNTTTLTFTQGLTHSYKSGVFNTSAAVSAQIVKVSKSTNLTITEHDEIVAPYWNGFTGGIIALEDSGSLIIDGTLNAKGRGFRGGTSASGYACALLPTANGFAGESWGGMGDLGRTANDGAGGAGNSGVCGFGPGYSNWIGAAGGGGAAYALAAEDRTSASFNFNPQVLQGLQGSSHGVANLSKMFLGSGGGAGGAHDVGVSSGGGSGGGIIIIKVDDLILGANGLIDARGNSGPNAGAPAGAGGGGSGGSILILADTNATIGNGQVLATGGAGGTANGWDGPSIASQHFRKGGDASVGRIHIDSPAGTGTSNPAAQ